MGLAVELWTCPQLVLVVARATWNLVLAQLTVTLMVATMVVHDDHGDDDDAAAAVAAAASAGGSDDLNSSVIFVFLEL